MERDVEERVAIEQVEESRSEDDKPEARLVKAKKRVEKAFENEARKHRGGKG